MTLPTEEFWYSPVHSSRTSNGFAIASGPPWFWPAYAPGYSDDTPCLSPKEVVLALSLLAFIDLLGFSEESSACSSGLQKESEVRDKGGQCECPMDTGMLQRGNV